MLLAWFVRDEPLWKLLLTRWRLKLQPARQRLRVDDVAFSRLHAGLEREKHRRRVAKKSLVEAVRLIAQRDALRNT